MPVGTLTPATRTDTGYTAPDGRPLYAECMQAAARIPPEFPVTAEAQRPLPTFDPSVNWNAGKPSPSPVDLPAFDLRSMLAADTTGWNVRRSACYEYSIAIPPTWTIASGFANAGYQQGESAVLVSPDQTAVIDTYAFYTPVYPDDPNLLGYSVSRGIYLLAGPSSIMRDGHLCRETYSYGDIVEGARGVDLHYFCRMRDDWFITFSVELFPPYSLQSAAEARAVLDSLVLR